VATGTRSSSCPHKQLGFHELLRHLPAILCSNPGTRTFRHLLDRFHRDISRVLHRYVFWSRRRCGISPSSHGHWVLPTSRRLLHHIRRDRVLAAVPVARDLSRSRQWPSFLPSHCARLNVFLQAQSHGHRFTGDRCSDRRHDLSGYSTVNDSSLWLWLDVEDNGLRGPGKWCDRHGTCEAEDSAAARPHTDRLGGVQGSYICPLRCRDVLNPVGCLLCILLREWMPFRLSFG
jgi:hypothetical protein